MTGLSGVWKDPVFIVHGAADPLWRLKGNEQRYCFRSTHTSNPLSSLRVRFVRLKDLCIVLPPLFTLSTDSMRQVQVSKPIRTKTGFRNNHPHDYKGVDQMIGICPTLAVPDAISGVLPGPLRAW